MSVKAILVLCAQAILLKSALGQSCTSRAAVTTAPRLAAPGLAGRAYNGLAAGLAGRGLAYNGPAAGCSGRGLAYEAAAGLAGNALAYDGLNVGCAEKALAYDAIYAPAMEFSPTSGGALPVSSGSVIAPVGISVASDNVYEGNLAVTGELPFVGTVAMEGVVPSAGTGAVNHACGNGKNAMISNPAAFAPAAALAPAAAIAPLAAYSPAAAIAPRAGVAASGLGLRGGWASRSCGCAI